MMDREVEKSKLTAERGDGPDKEDPKAGPPKLEDWQDFFSRVLIRSATNWYIEYAFRGIDEDELSDREVERIKLEDDERNKIARPFAELANKSKFTRKHGRTIVAMADSWDSLLTLGAWYNRVNRISRKHRKRVINVSSGQGQPQQGSNGHGHPHGEQPQWQYYGPGTG